MSTLKKVLAKWKTAKQPVPKDQVIAVLKKYFPGRYKFKGGSHITVRHPSLRGLPGFAEGRFSIAIEGGQKVKRWYLKSLVMAIEHLMGTGEIKEGEVD